MKNFLCGVLFCLLVLCAGPAHATMTSGTTSSGSVPGLPCTICYDTQTFTGTAGHGIFIAIVDSYGGSSITVLKPDGTALSSSTTQDFTNGSLPVSGTYQVRIASETVGRRQLHCLLCRRRGRRLQRRVHQRRDQP